MRTAICVALAMVALSAQPAHAWDPYANELDPGDQTARDPVPLVVPVGIYLVTDVYAGDTITRDGATTTYSTVTVQETPGTHARVLESVGTGQRSALDGASFNGRASLPDGRAVAGTYYEDFVLTPEGFVSVNIVFFQDDSLTTADQPVGPKPPTTTSDTPPPPPPVDGASVVIRAIDGAPTAQPRSRALEPDDRFEDRRSASAGISLSPTGPILSTIEVLRGRSVGLWPRAFVDGRTVSVRSWRLVSGTPDVISASSASGAGPCVVAWLTLAPAGSSFTVRFELITDALPERPLIATIGVTVRAPALLQ